jgi:hypothetical protein
VIDKTVFVLIALVSTPAYDSIEEIRKVVVID